MSGIACIVNWDGSPQNEQQLLHMIQVIGHRGPDGLTVQSAGCAGLGYAHFETNHTEQTAIQPVWLPHRSCGIVGDIRLDNRDELLNYLGAVSWLEPGSPDVAVVLATYEKFGLKTANLLQGDFAFIIWSEKDRTIYAARDTFGVKPLFYLWDKERLLLGSEPKQILTQPGVRAQPDDVIVGEYLFGGFQEPDRSFWQDVCRVRPGHYLVAQEFRAIQYKYWRPDPNRELSLPNTQAYYDRFRDLLIQAVSRRITCDYPVAIHLSGGFDSSAIAAIASKALPSSTRNHCEIFTLSALFPGLPCDESFYIEAMNRQCRVPNQSFSPIDEPFLDDLNNELWWIDSPIGNIQRGFISGGAAKLKALGARVLLDGEGGDELLHQTVYLQDLAVRHQFLTLLQETQLGSETSWNSFAWLLKDAMRPIVPQFAKSLKAYLRPRTRKPPPAWVNQDYYRAFEQYPSPSPQSTISFRSFTQDIVYSDFTSPYFAWGIEGLEARGAHYGYELRHPYCDRKLVEFVLAIPFEHRVSNGQWRALQQRGLLADLPPEILNRRRKTHFDSYILAVLNREMPVLIDVLFHSSHWASAKYVDKQQAHSLFRSYLDGQSYANQMQAMPLWKIAFLELWLRQLGRYKLEQFNTAS